MYLSLPEFEMPNRLAIKLKPVAEKIVRGGHPWVFEEAIRKQSADGKPGDLSIMYDQRKNKFLAVGLYDPHSPIRIKVLQAKTPATINAAWFQEKIAAAYALRAPLLATDTDSYRLIHGENDGLPSFIADVYGRVLVVKLYSLIWLPYLKDLLPALLEQTGCSTLVLRLSRLVQQEPETLAGLHDGQVLYGELSNPDVIFREHGLHFRANVLHGHKTGYFLDHRHNRKRIGELAKGKRVLDVFAYAGGFSVHALAGGARAVTSVDISAQALELAKRNVLLNDIPSKRHETLAVDAFDGLAELQRKGKRFELVIVDPPSFAKRAQEQERALQSYRRLGRLAAKLVTTGGTLVLASCSSRIKAPEFFEASLDAVRNSGRAFEEVDRTYHDIDHPIGFPEGAYLKSIYLTIL